MVAHIRSLSFQGVEARNIDVQVQLSSGLPAFTIVGLPDKAVAESRERVRASLGAIGLALPPKRITVNLSPADILKEGGHFDLPIALGILVAMDILPREELDLYVVLGELALDGAIVSVSGVLPAAIFAQSEERGLICPQKNGAEAAWAGDGLEVLAASSLMALINHFKGNQIIAPPVEYHPTTLEAGPDLSDIKGQLVAKRALEIAASGGHNMLMCGPPGAGKSMLAARLPGLLPPLNAYEALETSMIKSVAGEIENGVINLQRPYRDPHHSCSVSALVGGGQRARPGEISLAHNGILFLDELPEFNRAALEALRQPLETGRVSVARANAHITYPARVQLIAAMNPCRCGYLDDIEIACRRAPACAKDYQNRISGPLFDRIDLHVTLSALAADDLLVSSLEETKETTQEVGRRVLRTRKIQKERYEKMADAQGVFVNAQADGKLLEKVACPDAAGRDLLHQAVSKMKLTARGYHRVLRVARSLADMQERECIEKTHIAEALGYRRILAL